MEPGIRMLEKVWTADGLMLGLTQRLFHRATGVDPELQYYASYVEVENYELGSTYFVPLDFFEGRDPESGDLNLSVTFQVVLERTWARLPTFIARGEGTPEPLSTD